LTNLNKEYIKKNKKSNFDDFKNFDINENIEDTNIKFNSGLFKYAENCNNNQNINSNPQINRIQVMKYYK